MANVLEAFELLMAFIEYDFIMKAHDDGYNIDTFDEGSTYELIFNCQTLNIVHVFFVDVLSHLFLLARL